MLKGDSQQRSRHYTFFETEFSYEHINTANKCTPPQRKKYGDDIPILQKVTEAYIAWHAAMRQIEKLSRYTLGAKIDTLFTDTLELILYAAYANKTQKFLAVQKASTKLDALKYFLQIAWQLKALDHKTYARISAPLEEIGKMLGGWLKQVEKES